MIGEFGFQDSALGSCRAVLHAWPKESEGRHTAGDDGSVQGGPSRVQAVDEFGRRATRGIGFPAWRPPTIAGAKLKCPVRCVDRRFVVTGYCTPPDGRDRVSDAEVRPRRTAQGSVALVTAVRPVATEPRPCRECLPTRRQDCGPNPPRALVGRLPWSTEVRPPLVRAGRYARRRLQCLYDWLLPAGARDRAYWQ